MRRVLLAMVIGFLLFPFGMWFVWLWWPTTPLRVIVVDKTILSPAADEHRSLFWTLTHGKFSAPDGFMYDYATDYYGFFPLPGHTFRLRGLEALTARRVDSLAAVTDVAYMADTYGVYANEWYGKDSAHATSLLYGGLHPHDLRLMEGMSKRRTLIIAEFNTLGDPTRDSVRAGAERLLGVHWTGWSGRYFESLRAADGDVPAWAMRAYAVQREQPWAYTRSGVVLAHRDGRVAILEDGKHASPALPLIETPDDQRMRFGLPLSIPYPFWFDITLADTGNIIVSYYYFRTTTTGDSLLAHLGIPRLFPAVVERQETARMFYFCGDFAENPVSAMWTARLKGFPEARSFFFRSPDPSDRKAFFWSYYLPLMTRVLSEHASAISE